jgi:hypothetical protein
MRPPPQFRLVVSAHSFSAEEDDIDSHTEEHWRLEFIPDDDGLPLEDVIFVSYTRNYDNPAALENKLLDCDEETKEEMIVNEVEKWDNDQHFFTIQNSLPVVATPPKIDLPSLLPIIPYRFLKPGGISIFPSHIHKIVKYKGIDYVFKSANLPGDEHSLAQELRNYKLVEDLKWAAELRGIVRRQNRKEGILVRYYSGGDLRQHFDADEGRKQRWVIQMATALHEFEKRGYIQQDLKCANIVVEDSGDIRMIDLENAGGTKDWAHPDNLVGIISPMKSRESKEVSLERKEYVVYGFGKTVWELYVGGVPIHDEELKNAPEWVQYLVNGCLNRKFRSIAEVNGYLSHIDN